jgi:hypothetical protein
MRSPCPMPGIRDAGRCCSQVCWLSSARRPCSPRRRPMPWCCRAWGACSITTSREPGRPTVSSLPLRRRAVRARRSTSASPSTRRPSRASAFGARCAPSSIASDAGRVHPMRSSPPCRRSSRCGGWMAACWRRSTPWGPAGASTRGGSRSGGFRDAQPCFLHWSPSWWRCSRAARCWPSSWACSAGPPPWLRTRCPCSWRRCTGCGASSPSTCATRSSTSSVSRSSASSSP